jgi:HPt (histidine-containing phosphotransfer) domain-containing protein
MSKRDLSGAVDFAYLERFAMNDTVVIDEVLTLFREQAALWAPLLDAGSDGWKDAVHTIKGAARGVGAFALGDACEHAETVGASALPGVHSALDAALFDVAAYVHEQALASLKGDVLPLTQRVDRP